jgi:hypothetical protein
MRSWTSSSSPVLGHGVGAILRVQRAVDLGDAVELPEPADHLLDRGVDLRIVGLDRPLALDEHLLDDLVGIVGGLDDHLAALGLAVAGSRDVELLHADAAADGEGEDHEGEPSEDGGLAVLRAPSAGARREVAFRLHDDSWWGGKGTRADSRRSPPGSSGRSLNPQP